MLTKEEAGMVNAGIAEDTATIAELRTMCDELADRVNESQYWIGRICRGRKAEMVRVKNEKYLARYRAMTATGKEGER